MTRVLILSSLLVLVAVGPLNAGEIIKNGKLPCLSGVCVGEDVDQLKVKWLTLAQIEAMPMSAHDLLGEDDAQAKQFFKNNVIGLEIIDVRKLMPYFSRKMFDKRSLELLRGKSHTYCSQWPLDGTFLSDSGHLTKVRVVQDTDQRLKVVSIERFYKGLNEFQAEALWNKLTKEYPESTYGPTNLVGWTHDSDNYVVTLRHPAWTLGNGAYFGRWGDSFSEIRKLYEEHPERSAGPAGRNDFDYVLSRNSKCRQHVTIN